MCNIKKGNILYVSFFDIKTVKSPAIKSEASLLPDLDSNQDILNQNQLYYPYTIGQSVHSL